MSYFTKHGHSCKCPTCKAACLVCAAAAAKKPKPAKPGAAKPKKPKPGASRPKGERMTKPATAFEAPVLGGPHPAGNSYNGDGVMRSTYAAVVGLYVLDELQLAMRREAASALVEQPL